MECRETKYAGATWLSISGRIDGMTSPDLQKKLEDLILAGTRQIILNLSKVTYISSAGLRVFLSILKQIKKINGTMALYQPNSNVMDVIKVTGFSEIFPILEDAKQVDQILESAPSFETLQETKISGLKMLYTDHSTFPTSLFTIGSTEKTNNAAYSNSDVESIRAGDIGYGLGLAAMGGSFSEYKDHFGESIVIKNSLFTFPAVKQPAVDFMICSEQQADTPYHFLNGFGFGLDHRFDAVIHAEGNSISLKQIVDGLFSISKSDSLGVVFMSQCKGLWGMNLKKVPITENRPENNQEIFSPSNYTDWMNFPIEPEGINQILIGVGIACQNRDATSPTISRLLPAAENLHFHAAVFKTGPLGNHPSQFDDEMTRILNEGNALKVQHLLGKSLLGNTLVRIFELKE